MIIILIFFTTVTTTHYNISNVDIKDNCDYNEDNKGSDDINSNIILIC